MDVGKTTIMSNEIKHKAPFQPPILSFATPLLL
jgi:hypothetical protein